MSLPSPRIVLVLLLALVLDERIAALRGRRTRREKPPCRLCPAPCALQKKSQLSSQLPSARPLSQVKTLIFITSPRVRHGIR